MAEYINPQWRLPNEKTGNNKGYSMAMSASNNRVSTGYFLPSGTKPKSISYWFKNTDPSGWSTTGYNYTIHGGSLSLAGNGFGMGTIGSNFGSYLWFIGHSAGDYLIPTSATGVMTTDVWYHIVVTYDNSRTNNLHFYLDGVKIDETNETLDTSSANSVKIGSSATGGGNQGGRFMEITDVCIFNYALSDGGVSVGSTATGQIADLYASTNPMALANTPQAYYPLGNSAHMGSNYLTPNGALQDYVFDFDSDYIDFGTSLGDSLGSSYSGDLTVSMWLKFDSISTQNGLFYIGDLAGGGGSFWINSSISRLWLQANNGAAGYAYCDISSLNTTDWYNLTCVYKGYDIANSKIYINNVPQTLTTSGDFDYTYDFTGKKTTIADYYNTPPLAPFYGEMSNVQVFNTALSGPEVETLYNYGSPIQTLANIPQSSNLKAWYKLDATEIYNSTTTEWEVNNALSTYTSSLFVDNSTSSPSYVKINNLNSTSGLSEYSFSAWVDLKSVNTAYGGLINAQYTSNWAVLGNASSGGSSWRWDLRTSSGTTQASVTAPLLNQGWCHIAGTYDGANMKFYKNGEEVFTGAKTGTMQAGSFEVDLGFLYGSNDVNSGYSNFSIWSKGLTAVEVEELYNSGNPGDLLSHSAASNLLNWWKLNNLTDGLNDSKGSFNAVVVSDVSDKPGSVSTLNGESSGMSQTNLIQSDLLTTSSYSPYAISFDGNDHITLGSNNYGFPSVTSAGQTLDNLSISVWFKNQGGSGNQVLLTWWASGSGGQTYLDGFLQFNPSNGVVRFGDDWQSAYTFPSIPSDWTHMTAVKTTDNAYIYVNGSLVSTRGSSLSFGLNRECRFGGNQGAGEYFIGDISNISLWEYNLSASQVREVYNEGRPSNLHNFSGTAPVAWWQLGSNSSWTSPAWTVLDEIGSNDGTSNGMLENAIVDGVGTSGNGVSINMGSANNISGSSPNGEGNSLSVNMTLANIAGGVN